MIDDVLVAKGYRRVDRDQQFLMAPDMREWLPSSDPVWVVIDVVAGLDTSALHAMRRTGGAGRAGYDPDMLLTVLIWAWAQGQRSSRRIERLCARDVAFRVICAGEVPDHVTISRFRADCAQVVEELFTQVLVLCARVGLGRLGVVAMDSVKISSNASLSANRTEAGLSRAAAEQASADAALVAARSAAAEHAAIDAAEDEMFGPEGRGDEVPAELADPSARAARIAEALAQLKAENTERAARAEKVAERKRQRREAIAERRDGQLEAFLAQREIRGGAPMGSPPKEIRVQVLTANLAAARAAQQAKIDRYRAGNGKGAAPAPVEEYSKVVRVRVALDRALARRHAEQAAAAAIVDEPVAIAPDEPKHGGPKRNITDPQSRTMGLRGGGWVQGYNCQAVTTGDGLIIATTVGNNPSDTTAFTTTMAKAVDAAALIGAHQPPSEAGPSPEPGEIGVLLADAGYLSEDNLTAPGPDRLIAVGKTRDLTRTARQHPTSGPPPADATPIGAMAHRLATPEGQQLYKQRSHIAETPFGHAKHNLGFRRFTSRGIGRATAEFSFHALVHNLLKAISTGCLTPATC